MKAKIKIWHKIFALRPNYCTEKNKSQIEPRLKPMKQFRGRTDLPRATKYSSPVTQNVAQTTKIKKNKK